MFVSQNSTKYKKGEIVFATQNICSLHSKTIFPIQWHGDFTFIFNRCIVTAFETFHFRKEKSNSYWSGNKLYKASDVILFGVPKHTVVEREEKQKHMSNKTIIINGQTYTHISYANLKENYWYHYCDTCYRQQKKYFRVQ